MFGSLLRAAIDVSLVILFKSRTEASVQPKPGIVGTAIRERGSIVMRACNIEVRKMSRIDADVEDATDLWIAKKHPPSKAIKT
jgi:hypothetical protein